MQMTKRHTWLLMTISAIVLMSVAMPGWAIEPAETVVKLLGDDEDPLYRIGDHVGYSVAVDGNVAVVGAPYDDAFCHGLLGVPGADCGAVHVFIRGADGAWRRDIKLFAPDDDRFAEDRFGQSVAVEGDVIVVGAPGDNMALITNTDTGAVYVFRRTAGQSSWKTNVMKKLTASDADAEDELGYSVAISGGKILAGAPGDDHYLDTNTGAAYVFYQSAGVWNEVKIRAYDYTEGDKFGSAVAYSGDIAVIGAPYAEDFLCIDILGGQGNNCGTAYVYTGSDPQNWPLPRKLYAPDRAPLDHFGASVAVDGANVLVGAPNDWGSPIKSGSAHLFYRDVGGVWQHTKLTASDGKVGDHFGNAVSISGTTAVVGARDYSDLSGLFTGSAYVFAWDSRSGWREHAKLLAADRDGGDNFGYSVALDGDIAVIGAKDFEDEHCVILGEPSTLCNYGAAYVYTLVVKDDDHDGVDDAVDNCPDKANPEQADYDGDRIGDACDPDVDGDYINDDGDGSGVAGDNPCKGFPLVFNCDDNCPREKNSSQKDDDKDGHGSDCDACEKTGWLGTVSKIDFNNWTAEGCASCADGDNDTFYRGCDSYRTIAGIDCDDTDGSIKPGGTEVCNGKDDNCDGLIDNGVGTAYYDDYDNDGYSTGNTQLFCVRPSGTAHKLASELTSTTGDCNDWDAGTNPAAPEVCNNGGDENCNGLADEGFPKERYYLDTDFDGYARSDADGYPGGEPWVEACMREGPWLKTAAELRSITLFDCNDQDQNLWVSCDPPTCMDADGDGYWAGCDAYVTMKGPDCNDDNYSIPGPLEICDGLDNDCDGQIDEDISFYRDADGDGFGNPGMKLCMTFPGFVSNALDCDDSNALINPLMAETCNGIDDNCDGVIDIGGLGGEPYYKDEDNDGYSDGTMKSSCTGVPYGYKLAGELTAISGDCADTIGTVNPGAAEVCNAIDDNCNGAVDEKLFRECYAAEPETMGIGPCKAGIQVCQNGQYGECRGAVVPQEEICDLLDNDCDGTVNNNMVAAPASLQQGVCQGSLKVCAMTSTGQFGWQEPVYTLLPGYELQEVSCDARDNDCDGGVDESLTRPTTCGVGPCAGSTGAEACVSGVWSKNTCDPFAGAAPETCDSVDNDCNGTADDGIAPLVITCGVGECTAAGVTVCQAGDLIDLCTPGLPAPDDAICDGSDSDCDGLYDEDYLSLPMTCGIGACLAAGSTSCVIGEVVSVCTPLPPAPNDAVCDGIDIDCDGQADEDYVAPATTCGIGVCASTGLMVCQSGATINTCTPGLPTAEVCDGMDNDCDAATDEGFNRDGDMLADCFDTCPDDPNNDADADGVCGNLDNCPMIANADQADVDSDGSGNVCDACDNRPITGSVLASVDTLWPPDHRMVPVAINASALVTRNPDTQIGITTVGVTEYSRKASSTSAGENIYDENNFEPDYAINGNLTVDLRSERAGASTGRTYTITVRAADCSGSYNFSTQVEVPHDLR